MKAWLVEYIEDSYEEGGSEIVFAETREQAKYKSELYGEYLWVEIRATRYTKFDNPEGKMTDRLYLQNGWVVLCDCCDEPIYNVDEDTRFDSADRAYCSQECLSKREAKKRRMKIDK